MHTGTTSTVWTAEQVEWQVRGTWTRGTIKGLDTSLVYWREPEIKVGDEVEDGGNSYVVKSIDRVVYPAREVEIAKLTGKQIEAVLKVAAAGEVGLPTQNAARREEINGNTLWIVGCSRGAYGWIATRKVGTRPFRSRYGREATINVCSYFLTDAGRVALDAVRSEADRRSAKAAAKAAAKGGAL